MMKTSEVLSNFDLPNNYQEFTNIVAKDTINPIINWFSLVRQSQDLLLTIFLNKDNKYF